MDDTNPQSNKMTKEYLKKRPGERIVNCRLQAKREVAVLDGDKEKETTSTVQVTIQLKEMRVQST